MKKYSLLLFDIDGTLLDFDRSEDYALKKVLNAYNASTSPEVIKTYKDINKRWWHMLEQGKVTKRDIEEGRFKEFWQCIGLDVDHVESSKMYIDFLAQQAFVIDGALEVFQRAAERAEIAIVTNGIASVQYSRIEKSGLGRFTDKIIVSEEVGFAKPDQRYFSAALERCRHADKHDVLIIGDSLFADMKGGHDFGIDTCWYNPEGLKNTLGICITYTINNLDQILNIV